MKHLFCVGLIFTVLVAEGLSIELPSSFKICHRSDPKLSECMAEAVVISITSLAQGLKNFQVHPIEPLAIDRATIGQKGGAVSLQQEYKNLKIHGLTKGFKASDYSVDFDKCIIVGTSSNEQVDFVGDYKLDGKILLLPVTGNGRANISLVNLSSRNTMNCNMYEKNGETYLNVTKYTIKFSPKKVYLKFDNLFNGDKVLGDQMNKFINENSELLFKELQEPYEEVFGTVFANICNSIFSRVPLDKLFPK